MLARILLLITSACGQRQLNRSHYAGAHATYAEQRQRIQAAVGNYTFYVYGGGAFDAIMIGHGELLCLASPMRRRFTRQSG